MATLRPEGYFPRVRSSIRSIYTALLSRLTAGAWGSGTSRQRAGHWLRKFVLRSRMDFGDRSDLKSVLAHCFDKQLSFFT